MLVLWSVLKREEVLEDDLTVGVTVSEVLLNLKGVEVCDEQVFGGYVD